MRTALEIIELHNAQWDEVLGRVEQALDEKDATLIRKLFESYAYVTDLVEDKNTSIRRLRQLFFGAHTEKTAAVVGNPVATTDAVAPGDAAVNTELVSPEPDTDTANHKEETASPVKGHGRNGAAAYTGAGRIDVPHPTLQAGDACPACRDGTLYEKTAGVIVRITGQPPVAATIYELQKLRCNLCDQVFTATPPPEAGERKYVSFRQAGII